ncbi:MAG: hypothetical protein PHT07_10415 [Paludibacter sp.]|nr:hypothetical protein [Paludibacter sp.]
MNRRSMLKYTIPPLNTYSELPQNEAHKILMSIAMTIDNLTGVSMLQRIGDISNYETINDFIREYIYSHVNKENIVTHVIKSGLSLQCLEQVGLYRYLDLQIAE